MNSAPAETERIREALLQAAEADFLQAVGADESPAAFSLSYQRWEAKFLRNPRALAKRLARPLWQRAARAAACAAGLTRPANATAPGFAARSRLVSPSLSPSSGMGSSR